MACRVGITTDPEERKRYWQSRYRSLRNWRIVGQYNSKTKAQQEETRLAKIWGCEASPGGVGPEYAVWYVYAFEHDGY